MILITMIWAAVTPFLLLRIGLAIFAFVRIVQLWREQEEGLGLIAAVAMTAAMLSPLVAGQSVLNMMLAVVCVMAVLIAWWLFIAMASWREELVRNPQSLGDIPALQGQKWGEFELFNVGWADKMQYGLLAPWSKWNNVRTRTAVGVFIIVTTNLIAWFVIR